MTLPQHPDEYNWQQFKRFGFICLCVATAMLIVGTLYWSIMVAIVASGIIAYIFDPLVDWLCHRFPVRRKVIVGTLMIFIVAVLGVGAFLIVPFIYEEFLHILERIPEAIVYIEQSLVPAINWMKKSRIFPDETIEAGFRRLNLLQNLGSASTTVQELVLRTPALLEAAFNVVMVPLVTYLILAEKEATHRLVKRWTPVDVHPLMGLFLRRIDHVLRSVVKGQFLIAFILSLLYMMGFTLIGVPSGIAIGAIAGFCRLVPYLDVVVGIALCSIVVLTQGAGIPVFVAVLGVIAVVQSLDGMIITPRIIGDRAGLHPIVVIASVFAFGSWFGLLGILLAVPCVAAVVVAAQICLPYVRSSPFFGENHAERLSSREQPPKRNSI
jgi:predicted PurR-regulated permease PerM